MYEQLNPNQDLAAYHAKLVETLMRDMAFSIHKTLDQPDETSIHDLRRICLRLRHALRLFAKLLPRKSRRKVQRRLAALQELAGGVRACDVALETLRLDSIASAVSTRDGEKIAAALALERRRSLRPLRARLRKIQRSDVLPRWRNRLLASG